MIVIKPGNYEPELEGTCPRCGQVERFSRNETQGILIGQMSKKCGCCGWPMDIKKIEESEHIDRPSIRDIEALFYQTGGYMPHFAKQLFETFDIRRKK